MTRSTRRITAAASAIAAAGALGVSGIAQAGTTESGNLQSGPVSMEYNVTKSDDGNVTGTAQGRVKVGGLGLIEASGPVECFEKDGNKIGFFYSMTEAKPSIMKLAKPGVYMNITTNDDGDVKSVAYSMIPGKQGKSGCKPTGGIIPATGSTSGS